MLRMTGICLTDSTESGSEVSHIEKMSQCEKVN